MHVILTLAAVDGCGGVQLTEISPEIVALLDGLKDRDELEELAKLFEESSQAWTQISEPERKILLARAAALMAERKA